MKGWTKRVALSAAAALVAFLLAALPASGEATLSFIDPDALSDANDGSLKNPYAEPAARKWARQGGYIGVMYDNPSLDQPVRRVLIPYLDAEPIGCSDFKAHSATISVKAGGLSVGDYVMVGGHSVRRALKVTPPPDPTETGAEDVVLLDKPFHKNSNGREDVFKVKQSVISAASDVDWRNDYGLYAGAFELVELEREQVTYHNGITRYEGADDIADSNIGFADPDNAESSIARRLTGRGDGYVNRRDALIVRVEEIIKNPPYIENADYYEGNVEYTVEDVRHDRVEFTETGDDEDKLFNNPEDSNNPNHKVYLIAWFTERNVAEVNVRSRAHPEDTTLAIRETLPDSGKFALRIQAVEFGTGKGQFSKPVLNSDDGIPKLPVNPRDAIAASTADSTATIAIETSAPVFIGLSPANGAAARNFRPEVSAQVMDVESGMDAKNIEILFRVIEEGGAVRDAPPIKPSVDGDISPIFGGFAVSARMRGDYAPSKDALIHWWARAADNAGNVGYSDTEPMKNGAADVCDAAPNASISDLADSDKCQPYAIRVDRTPPKLLRAETGRRWNSIPFVVGGADGTEYRPTRADKSSVLAIFDSHLDVASVSASDFAVNGAAPLEAVAYNVKVRDGGDSVLDVGRERGYAFLRLPYEMDAGAAPNVALVGAVLDLAGNVADSGAVAALDRIAPALTVAFKRGDRPVSKGAFNLTISADEDVGAPSVAFRKLASKTVGGETAQTLGAANEGIVAVKYVSATEYRASIIVGPIGDPIDGANGGLFNVVVKATDAAGNAGVAGVPTPPIDADANADAILFEVDRSVPDPDLNPDADGVQSEFATDDTDAFIVIDFSAEANEYDMDAYGEVTLLSATLDGADISDALRVNDDGNAFLYKASGLALGDRALEIAVMDAAGNRRSAPSRATVTIRKREPFSLKLTPGWNFVSIPGDPADPAINVVMPPDRTDITAALGYDRSEPGHWLRANRGADGLFQGNLENIASTRAYWIKTDSFASLNVDIPKPSLGEVRIKPAIPVFEGWNAVPILDADGDFKLELPPGRHYFSALTGDGTSVVIDAYDTLAGVWKSVAPQDVEIGKAYWVYASRDGVIVP